MHRYASGADLCADLDASKMPVSRQDSELSAAHISSWLWVIHDYLPSDPGRGSQGLYLTSHLCKNCSADCEFLSNPKIRGKGYHHELIRVGLKRSTPSKILAWRLHLPPALETIALKGGQGKDDI